MIPQLKFTWKGEPQIEARGYLGSKHTSLVGLGRKQVFHSATQSQHRTCMWAVSDWLVFVVSFKHFGPEKKSCGSHELVKDKI